jgi:hypothetical protein
VRCPEVASGSAALLCSVVWRPPRRTLVVKSSPLQFSGFSVVPSRDIRAIRGLPRRSLGEGGFVCLLIFPRNLAAGFTHYLSDRPKKLKTRKTKLL